MAGYLAHFYHWPPTAIYALTADEMLFWADALEKTIKQLYSKET